MTILKAAPANDRILRPATLGHYCTSLLNRLSDAYWEARLGIATRGNAPSRHHDANRYGYLSYHTYFSILDRLELRPDDVVVDLGCGKGRVVCAAATRNIRAAIGVEIDPQLCDCARTNAAQLRGRRAELEIVGESATEFDFDPATAIILFHPFGSETLERVLDRLRDSLERRPRTLRIVYANPVYGELLDEQPWLERFESWNPGGWSRIKFPVHFYRSLS